jgi:hypothetical protein
MGEDMIGMGRGGRKKESGRMTTLSPGGKDFGERERSAGPSIF